jgi:YesN/AraC family two-component response regulator
MYVIFYKHYVILFHYNKNVGMVSVIVVDDDPDSVKIMSQYLKIKDVKVIGEASGGKEAVELYKELKPDVIVTDMKMPEYDGVYVINEIKKFDPDAKIIVVTAYQEYKFDRDAVFATLIKPYKIEDLMNQIKATQK